MYVDLTELRKVLDYDPKSGAFFWKERVANCVQVGMRAGNADPRGYRQIRYKGVGHYEHALAYAFMTGKWPAETIDHINRIKGDNRWINLREASTFQQKGNYPLQHNNKTGVRGVRFKRRKYEASLAGVYLGRFDTLYEASAAYDAEAKKRYGQFY